MPANASNVLPALVDPNGHPIVALTAAQAPTLAIVGAAPTRVLSAFGAEFDSAIAAAATAAAPALTNASAVVLDARPCFQGIGSWAPRATWTLLEMALDAPAGSPARAAAVRFLQKRYPTYEWFAGAWEINIAGAWSTLTGIELQTGFNVETQAARARFVEMVAEKYIAALARAARAAMPGKLILGPALDADAPAGAFTASAKFCDAVVLADASPAAIARAVSIVSKKPIVVADGGGWRVVGEAPTVAPFIVDATVELRAGSLGEKPALLDLLPGDGALAPAITGDGDTRVVFARERDRHSLVFDSGSGDGFTVTFAAPASATGYSALLLDVDMRAGLEYKVVLTTADAAFSSHVLVGGAAGRRRVVVPFDRLIPDDSGRPVLDMATLRGVGLALRGGQLNGTIKLYGAKLYRPSE